MLHTLVNKNSTRLKNIVINSGQYLRYILKIGVIGIVAFGITAPPFINLFLIYKFGVNVPWWDEWGYSLSYYLKMIDGQLQPSDLWLNLGTHRVTLHFAIALMLQWFTNYNRLAEMYAGVVARIVSLILVWHMLWVTTKDISRVVVWPLTIVASLLIFGLSFGRFLLIGWVDLIYGLTLLCAITVIWALSIWPGQWRGVLVAIVASIAGTLVYSLGMILWGIGLLIMAANVMTRVAKLRWFQFGVWILVGALILGIHFSTLIPDPTHNTVSLSIIVARPSDPIYFVLAFLGGGFLAKTDIAIWMGVVGLGILGGGIYWALLYASKPNIISTIIPWVMLAVWVVISAGMNALGRLQFGGVEYALRRDHLLISNLFWLGLIIIITLLFVQYWHLLSQIPSVGEFILLGIFLGTIVYGYIFNTFQGWDEIRDHYRMALIGLDNLLVYDAAPDEPFAYLLPDANAIRQLASVMEEKQIGPFVNRPVGYQSRYFSELSTWRIQPAMAVEISDSQELAQTFVSRCRQLARFDLRLGYGSSSDFQPINISLVDEETGQLLFNTTIDDQVIRNQWQQIMLPQPVTNAGGKIYRIVLSSPSYTGQAPYIWGSKENVYPDGEAFYNNQPTGVDMAFRYACVPSSHSGDIYLDLGRGFGNQKNIVRKWIRSGAQEYDVITAQAPSSLDWPIILPPNAQITLETRLLMETDWFKQGDGVDFRISVEHQDGQVDIVLDQHLALSGIPDLQETIPVTLDLSQYAEQSITLRFSTEIGPDGNGDNDTSAWEIPKLTINQ